jgi:hypothetical protein
MYVVDVIDYSSIIPTAACAVMILLMMGMVNARNM